MLIAKKPQASWRDINMHRLVIRELRESTFLIFFGKEE